jgi:hypothetical protein
MAKEPKTRRELEDIVMREARASGKCADLQSIAVVGPGKRGHSNWDIGTTSTHPTNLISSACRLELNMIVGRLQAQYDLSDD